MALQLLEALADKLPSQAFDRIGVNSNALLDVLDLPHAALKHHHFANRVSAGVELVGTTVKWEFSVFILNT